MSSEIKSGAGINASLATTVKTFHSPDCKRVFNRYDKECPRCQELVAGSKARSWKNHNASCEARLIAEIRAHNCTISNCGPICTFGDF